MPKTCFVMMVTLLCLPVAEGFAQQVDIQIQEGPYYVGEPIVLRVTARGFEEDPPPQCDTGVLPAGLSVRLAGVRPSVSSFTQIINGAVTSSRRVVYAFDYHVVVEQPGAYRLEPFTVRQGTTRASGRPVEIRVGTIQSDGDMRVALVLPTGPVYPGQRVPVEIQWWYAGDLNNVRNLVIRSDLFDRFTFVDTEVNRDDTLLPIQTKDGTVQIKARVERRTLNGREFVVLSGGRQLIVDKHESVELAPISARVEKVTRWGRGFFGRRQAAAAATIRAIGKPVTLQIKRLPLDAAPESFAGAVGHGFTMSVKADRTVLRVGDPIVLAVTLQGDGNLEQAGPPRLLAQGVLNSKRFRPAAGDVPGTVTDNQKRFSMTVRVLDQEASEIPPIPYTWFDPDSERFETTRSAPIALRVLPGQVVTAQDVVGGSDSVEEADAKQAVESSPTHPSGTVVRSNTPFDLSGADLAIETNADRLLIQESQRFGGYPTHVGIYAGSVALMMVGWWRRRVASADPEVGLRRRAIKQDVQQIHEAVKLPSHEAAGQIAAALRRLAPRAAGERRSEIDQLLAECDTVAFAPASTPSVPLDGSLHVRAVAQARAILEENT